MAPDRFKAAWTAVGDELEAFVEGTFGPGIPASARDFLTNAGLPAEAAPCLSFSPKYRDSFEGMDLPSDVLAIGSNGAGDPIVLDPSATVLYFNHDADFSPVYINRNVECLAEALIGYRHLISETQRRGGEDAFLDGDVPNDLLSEFTSLLGRIDPAALQIGAMWADEVASVLAMRQESER